MLDNVLNKINVYARILILICCIIILLISKSIYLTCFMMILLMFLIILTNKNVKFYIETIKISSNYLLFIFIAYIIITRDIIDSIYLLVKIILIIIYLKQFMLTVNFEKFVVGLKTIFNPIKIISSDKISYSIVLFIYFISYYLNSKKQIFKNYNKDKRFINTFSLKYNILPRLFLSALNIKKLESSLKLKYFDFKLEKTNKFSIIILIFFIILLIIVFFKEVIV